MGKWWVIMILLLAFGDRDGCERYPVFTHAYGGIASNSSTRETRPGVRKGSYCTITNKDLVEDVACYYHDDSCPLFFFR